MIDKISFETTSCDICGSSSSIKLIQGHDLMHSQKSSDYAFTLVRCQDCYVVRQNPRPTESSISLFYQGDYQPYIKTIDQVQSRFKKADRRYGMKKRIKYATKHATIGNLIDVGCGSGIFIAEMAKVPEWTVSGLEPTPSACNYAKEATGLKIFNQPFLEALIASSNFEVITMWNVFEHLYEPTRSLKKVHSLLKEDGLFVFSIPNLNAIDKKVFGNSWIGWELPRHIYLFSESQIKDLLLVNGFDFIESSCVAGSHSSFGLSFEYWLRGKLKLKEKNISIITKIYRSIFFRAILFPIFWLVAKTKTGTIITIIAKKNKS